MKTPEEIARLERIEAAATKIEWEIREAKKIGQFISTEWIMNTLEDALKDKKPHRPCEKCGYPT